jgi:hypothetical protein
MFSKDLSAIAACVFGIVLWNKNGCPIFFTLLAAEKINSVITIVDFVEAT